MRVATPVIRKRGSSLILALAMITIISVAIVRGARLRGDELPHCYYADLGAARPRVRRRRCRRDRHQRDCDKVADEGAVGPDDPEDPPIPCTGLDYAAVGKAPAITVTL